VDRGMIKLQFTWKPNTQYRVVEKVGACAIQSRRKGGCMCNTESSKRWVHVQYRVVEKVGACAIQSRRKDGSELVGEGEYV
jgi:hypothetical protein